MLISDSFSLFVADKMVYCAPATVTYYKNILHRFHIFLISEDIFECDDINADVLKRFISSLRLSGVKSTSIHTYFRGIKNFCSWGILEGIIKPFNYHLKLPRQDPYLELPLSASEADDILKYIRQYCLSDKELFFRLMLDCGLRSSEALNLKYQDIDHINGLLHINQSKFDKSRIVPVPDCVLSLSDPDGSGRIFSFGSSGKNSFFVRLKKICPRVHAHLLRHTFATSYMMSRKNLDYLSNYLGHSSYDVTKIYIRSAFQCDLAQYDIYRISEIFK